MKNIGITRSSSRGSLSERARLLTLVMMSFILAAGPVVAQDDGEYQLNWQRGPMTAAIGNNLAEITIGEDRIFLDASETKRFLEMNQNPIAGTELATVASIHEGENWFVIFEFDDMGFIPDDEKDDLDADEILESIREGTEASNEMRRERGWPEMSIVGWEEEPNYDEYTNNLSWTIIGESEGQRNINRLIKLLGRRGVMTATLVASPDELAFASVAVDSMLNDYSYKPGSTYAEYVPGTDKLAEYGLAALVVGGAGAALVKSGLLARFWKPIAAALAALGAGIKRLFFGGRSADHDPQEPIV